MRIVEISVANYSSVGNIVLNIANYARNDGFEVFTCCKNSKKTREFKYNKQLYIGYRCERILSEILVSITKKENSYNYFGTKKFIKQLKQIKPDLIHLHTMHDSYVNMNMLINFINDYNIPVIWTFHDCWPMTAKCTHFENNNCYKWKNGCYDCMLNKNVKNCIDIEKKLWIEKKKQFSSIKNLTIVSPSVWLSNYVKQSFFDERDIFVINNGIDLEKFKQSDSSFREKYKIENKFVILGVSYGWKKNKGLDVFIELSKCLSDDYQIVLVGTDDEIDELLPNNIVSIHRTYNQQELINIYSNCDLFVNPTLEDNFPTVNIESLACGLPVLTYETGGSPEIIEKNSGLAVPKKDIKALQKEIIRIKENKPFKKVDCILRSRQFDSKIMCKKYTELYKNIYAESHKN